MNNYDQDTVYLICECGALPDDISATIIQENYVESPTGKIPVITIETVLQSFNVENWNKRIYDDYVVMDALDKDPMIQHDLKHKQWCGEFGHPLDLDPRRQLIIDPATASHRILKYWKEGSLLKAHVRTLPYQWGIAMALSSLDGMPSAFSMRGMGSVDLKTRRAKAPLKIRTYDQVNRPSHKEAYEDKILSESAGGIYIPKKSSVDIGEIIRESAMFIPADKNKLILLEQSKDFILSKSENTKIIQDLFKIDSFENAVLSESGLYMDIKINNGTTARMPVEKAIALQYSDILGSYNISKF